MAGPLRGVSGAFGYLRYLGRGSRSQALTGIDTEAGGFTPAIGRGDFGPDGVEGQTKGICDGLIDTSGSIPSPVVQ